jgi:HD-like signal output (HDOD) protein
MADPTPTDPVAARFLRDIATDLSAKDLRTPTFIAASLRARVALKHPNLSTAELARVVGGEPVLSARVVALANSAAMQRGGKPITDLRSAVTRVGQNAVRNVAVALALEQITHTRELEPFRLRAAQTWAHSLEVGVLAHVLARYCSSVGPDEALFAGLVHDLGHFYAMWRAAQYPELTRTPERVRTLVRELHPSIGAALLHNLKLGDSIVRAVREHELEPASLAQRSLSQILSIANRSANAQAPAPAELPPAGDAGELNEQTAQQVLAEHLDEVAWLMAVMKG